MVSWKRFLYLLISPLTLTKSSCAKASIASSTLSHILASMCPLRSPRVSARYGSPPFLGLTCRGTTTKLGVMTLFSCCSQSETKNSFMVHLLRSPPQLQHYSLITPCHSEPASAARNLHFPQPFPRLL